jgi:NADPH-dependent curcumin reductase CurA
MAFQVFNKDFQLGSDMYAASQDLRELVKDFWKQIDEEFMPRNSLKIHPVKIIQNGLEGVPESHKQMLDGQVSGWKFVARTADTPGI